MRKLLATLAISAVVCASFAQTTTTTNTTVSPQGTTTTTTTTQIGPFMTQNNLSWEDAASALAIARATGMDPNVVITQRGTTATSYYDMAPAYVIAQQSGKPVGDIMTMYTNGATWYQIANQLNVSPTYWSGGTGTTNSVSNQDFVNGVWRNILQTQYAMTPEDYNYFTTEKYPLNEVVVADVYSRELGRPVRDVYTMYSTNSNKWPAWQSSGEMSSSSSSTQTTITTERHTEVVAPPPAPAPTVQENDQIPANHHTQTVFSQNQDQVTNQPMNNMTTTTHRVRHTMRRRSHRHHRRHC